MNDFIRLMFDDGASRPPVVHGVPSSFNYHGVRYNYTIVRDEDQAKMLGIWEQRVLGVWLWSENYLPGDSWNSVVMLDDPQGWGDRHGFDTERVWGNFRGGDVVFLWLEKVAP